MNQALESSRTLVALWSSESRGARGALDEIIRFSTLSNRDPQMHHILPVVLGGAHLIDTLPSVLAERQAVIVDDKAYAAGPQASLEELERVALVVSEIVASEQGAASTPPQTPEHPVSVVIGGTVRDALEYGAGMLRSGERSEAQRRTAALLGALIAAPRVSSTTGQMVELLAQRLKTMRNLDEAIASAAQAAGLSPPVGLLTMAARDRA